MTVQGAQPVLQIECATLTTSIGDDLPTSVAAFVAKRKYFRYFKWNDTKVLTAPAPDIVGDLCGEERLERLLLSAWNQMKEQLQTRHRSPTLFLIVVPDWESRYCPLNAGKTSSQNAGAWKARITDTFRPHFQHAGLPVTDVLAYTGGSEACHFALASTFNALRQQTQPSQIVLLAADSLCDPAILQQDLQKGLIYDDAHSSGWVPGEASACLLLRPVRGAQEASSGSLILYAPQVSDEPKKSPRWPSDQQGDGRELQQALGGALDTANVQPHQINLYVSDSDGSRWRLEDEMAALDRLTAIRDSSWRAQSLQPAELLGQLGAAWGAVQWALIAGLHHHRLSALSRAMLSTQDVNGFCSAGMLEYVRIRSAAIRPKKERG